MPVGPFVRGLFVDLDDWVARLKQWVPQAPRILEVGCGEGAMTGDDVAYLTAQEARALIDREFGGACVRDICHVRPWGNNLAFLIEAT